VWYSLELGKDIVRGQRDRDGKTIEYRDRLLRAFRNMYMDMFPSPKKFWMQKPIGSSFVRNLGRFWEREADFIDWYWETMVTLFPDGRFLTILRNPCDVVLSSADYWGMDQRDAWISLGVMARILLHSNSLISHAIRFDNLVNEPEAEIRRLCDAAAIPFDASMLQATKVVHVPKIGTFVQPADAEKERIERKFSRQEQWANLDRGAIEPDAVGDIRMLWDRYGVPLELPTGI
jgi:hypothetical protein